MKTKFKIGQLISSVYLPDGKYVIVDVWEQQPQDTVGNRRSSYENKFKAVEVNDDGLYKEPFNQIEFSTCGAYTGSIAEINITILEELEVVFMSSGTKAKLNEQLSKKPNATYIVKATNMYDDESRPVIYVGTSQAEADTSVATSSELEDFYKEIWIDGKKIRSYYKSYKSSDWSLEDGKTEDVVVDALTSINNLGISVAKIRGMNDIKQALDIEEQNELEEAVRNIFGQVHSIYTELEKIRVPK